MILRKSVFSEGHTIIHATTMVVLKIATYFFLFHVETHCCRFKLKIDLVSFFWKLMIYPKTNMSRNPSTRNNPFIHQRKDHIAAHARKATQDMVFFSRKITQCLWRK